MFGDLEQSSDGRSLHCIPPLVLPLSVRPTVPRQIQNPPSVNQWLAKDAGAEHTNGFTRSGMTVALPPPVVRVSPLTCEHSGGTFLEGGFLL